MLSLSGEVDAQLAFKAWPELTEHQLSEWLSRLRGPPLSGLEDTGSTEFQTWVDHQKKSINDQLEAALSQLYARFERAGRGYAAELIRARAELIGLPLHASETVIPPELDFEWPSTVDAVRSVLQRAQSAPQLILLHGHLGFRRAVLEAAAENTPWHTVQLQGSADKRLVQAALSQQLNQLTAPHLQVHQPQAASTTGELMLMGELVTRSAKPMLIAVHDAAAAGPWLIHAVRYALDLPAPLVIALSLPLLRSLGQLSASLGQLDWGRVHTLRMTPMGIGAVARALARRAQSRDQAAWSQTGDAQIPDIQISDTQMPDTQTLDVQPPDTQMLRRQAAWLAQQSEGSPLYLRSLLLTPAPLSSPAVPETVRNILLSQLADLSPELRGGLVKLAQIQGRFSPGAAAALLGQQAELVLAQATEHELLLNSGVSETVWLPSLSYQADDAEDHLTFASELLRAALAGSLPAPERRRLREILVELFMPLQPEVSQWYARRVRSAAQLSGPNPDSPRADLPRLDSPRSNSPHSNSLSSNAASAQGQSLTLTELLGPPEISPQVLSADLGEPSPIFQPAQRASDPSPGPGPRREIRSANGYRVALEGGFLEVLRRGQQSQPPQLLLRFAAVAAVAAGRWTLVARLDLLRPAPYRQSGSQAPPSYALGLRTGTEPRRLYSPEPVADHMTNEASGDTANLFKGVVPLGTWFRLCGEGGAGELELSLRAVDIALTVASLTWANQRLLPAE